MTLFLLFIRIPAWPDLQYLRGICFIGLADDAENHAQ